MKNSQGRVIRFRRWSSMVFACVTAGFFGVLFFGMGGGPAYAGESRVEGVVALILMLLFVPVLIWFIFKLCVFSGVDVSEDRVTVRNFSEETEVAISLIDSVRWQGGVRLVLKDGTKVKSIAFPDSLFSFVLQYRNFRRVARRLGAEIEKRSHGLTAVDSVGVQRRKEWSLPLLFSVGLFYFSLLAFSYLIFS